MQKAIAIFARAPVPGQVKSRLAQDIGDETAAELYAAMLRDTLGLACRAARSRRGCEVALAYTPHDAFNGGPYSLNGFWDGVRLPQCDGGLGERMLDCMTQLRRRGAAQIVLLGSDTPDLPPAFVMGAFERLDSQEALAPSGVKGSSGACNLVFGPARDGGFYLMAMDEAASDETISGELFAGVEWSTERTLKQVEANAARLRLGVAFLPLWGDVDTFDDLQRLKARLFRGESRAPATRRCLRTLTTDFPRECSEQNPRKIRPEGIEPSSAD